MRFAAGETIRAALAMSMLARTAVVVLVLNGVFLGLLLVAASVPADRLAERAMASFESGALSTTDWLPFNSDIGWHQYNDCVILQMISNDGSRFAKAIGPILYYPPEFRRFCGAFHQMLLDENYRTVLESFQYTRYWHGHNAVAAIILSFADFSALRVMLKAAMYISVLGLAVLAWLSPGSLRFFGIGMGGFLGLFWGLPYYAQSPSHGPGDMAVVLGFVGLVTLLRRGCLADTYLLACGAFGAVAVYMEFLTGLLPTAVAFLAPLSFVGAERAGIGSGRRVDRWLFVALALAAFSFGAVLTVIMKQALATMIFGWPVIDAFSSSLQNYATNPDFGVENRLVGALYALATMVGRWGTILSYGSLVGAVALFVGSLSAWIAAGVLAIRSRSTSDLDRFFALALGAMLVFVWILLLPTHASGHPHMVRILVAPIACGWIALALQFYDRPRIATQDPVLTADR
jgi:hypothetical protein